MLRVPRANGVVWFKACEAVQAFEPPLTARLFSQWPDRVSEVVAHDEEHAWLLLADAGTPISALGNPPETWLEVLPRYAELQRGEVGRAQEHLERGVPDLRLATLPERYESFLAEDLPIESREVDALRAFAPRFLELCEELTASAIPETIQHDDLHMANVYGRDGAFRVLDWGDSSVAHPFFSLVVTFRFLDEINKLQADDPWFARLRDAYLEPWGSGLADTFALAQRVGIFAHAFAWARQRAHLDEAARLEFDGWFSVVLRRALAAVPD